MKKIVTLVLAIALLMTSVVAIAETKATPNINTFAKMTTKFIEGSATQAKRYEIKLSKPVTKLWVLWAEKGAEPEELAVDENLSATALAVEHKYMPGIKQSIGTARKSFTTKESDGWTLYSEEICGKVYWKWEQDWDEKDPKNPDSVIYIRDDVEKNDKWTIYATSDEDGSNVKYLVFRMTEWGPDAIVTDDLAEIKAEYEEQFPGYTVDLKAPTKVLSDKKGKDKFGNPTDKVIDWKDGSIQGTKTTTSINKKAPTNKATLGDRAFATLEGVTEDFAGWVVYRNRFGNFVAIEAYEGQL